VSPLQSPASRSRATLPARPLSTHVRCALYGCTRLICTGAEPYIIALWYEMQKPALLPSHQTTVGLHICHTTTGSMSTDTR
jgi:hypothetical protein